MGLFDMPLLKDIEEPSRNDNGKRTEINCERCGQKFSGYTWMIKSKKEITCPDCFKSDNFNREDNN